MKSDTSNHNSDKGASTSGSAVDSDQVSENNTNKTKYTQHLLESIGELPRQGELTGLRTRRKGT